MAGAVSELFTIRDVTNPAENYPRIAPNFNNEEQSMYTFLQTPPQQATDYNKNINTWNAGPGNELKAVASAGDYNSLVSIFILFRTNHQGMPNTAHTLPSPSHITACNLIRTRRV